MKYVIALLLMCGTASAQSLGLGVSGGVSLVRPDVKSAMNEAIDLVEASLKYNVGPVALGLSVDHRWTGRTYFAGADTSFYSLSFADVTPYVEYGIASLGLAVGIPTSANVAHSIGAPEASVPTSHVNIPLALRARVSYPAGDGFRVALTTLYEFAGPLKDESDRGATSVMLGGCYFFSL